jgi:hypothetical protein
MSSDNVDGVVGACDAFDAPPCYQHRWFSAVFGVRADCQHRCSSDGGESGKSDGPGQGQEGHRLPYLPAGLPELRHLPFPEDRGQASGQYDRLSADTPGASTGGWVGACMRSD